MAKTPKPEPDRYRSKELAKIHIAKTQLGLDEDAYRTLLERVTGLTSAAAMNARQRDQVLRELARLGFRAPNHRAPTNAHAPITVPLPFTGAGWGKDRLLAKIGAILAEAHRPWAYADGMAQRMFHRESLRFCTPDQLGRIVAALTYDQNRRKRRATPSTS